MEILTYITENALILVPVLLVIGQIIKGIEAIPDKWIPLILLPLADTYVHHTERYGRGLLKPRHAPTEDEETARPLEP